MGERENKIELIELVDNFAMLMKSRLLKDEERWKGTWRRTPAKGQEERIWKRLERYISDFRQYGLSLPWEKMANYAFIGWVRETYPELSEVDEQNE